VEVAAAKAGARTVVVWRAAAGKAAPSAVVASGEAAMVVSATAADSWAVVDPAVEVAELWRWKW